MKVYALSKRDQNSNLLKGTERLGLARQKGKQGHGLEKGNHHGDKSDHDRLSQLGT